MDYLYQTNDDGAMRYDERNAFVTRDQSGRTADETINVVICDIAELAQASGLSDTATTAAMLAEEVMSLSTQDSDVVEYWSDVADQQEKIQDILRQAEQLDGIRVDWDGDGGTVTISLADKWEPCPADELPEYI